MFTEEPCKEYFVNVTLVERVINAILLLGNQVKVSKLSYIKVTNYKKLLHEMVKKYAETGNALSIFLLIFLFIFKLLLEIQIKSFKLILNI